MRVLHLTRDFPPRCTGGLSTAVGGLVRAAAAAGVEGAVLSFDAWRPRRNRADAAPPTEERDPPVLRVSSPDHLDAARAFAARVRPDLLQVHDDLLWELTAELRDALHVPAVSMVHVLHAEQDRLREVGRQPYSSVAQSCALAGADRVIAPSHAVDARIADRVDAARRRVARLGIEAPAARGERRTLERAVFAGRFADLNGTAEIFAAAPRLLERVPAAELVIAGGLPENPRSDRRWRRRWDDAATPAMRQRAELAGWLGPEALRSLLASSGVLLAPSWFETFGQVVLEGMLHGLAIVAGDTGALRELVGDDEACGPLVPPRDPDALVDAAVSLLADPARIAAAGQRAAERAAAYLWPRRIGEHIAVWRELT